MFAPENMEIPVIGSNFASQNRIGRSPAFLPEQYSTLNFIGLILFEDKLS
jgi:hypothetical protein